MNGTMRHAFAASAAIFLTAVALWAQAQPAVISDADIRKILAERIDVQHQGIGIVVGVLEPAGRRVVAYGSLAPGDSRTLDGDTVFEIGSITKVFTSLLLADAVERKDVSLEDHISKFLPPTVKTPERGRPITLQDLSQHTSGLPRLPGNMAPKDPSNPYGDYTVDQLYAFLSAYQLPRDVGAQYEYSNLGGGLLGHVLARRAGMDYEALVKSRILGPLGMKSTSVTLTPEMKAHMAIGHNPAMQPVPNWDLPVLTGAGALRSSTNDMLTFLAAVMGYTQTPLGPAMARMVTTRYVTQNRGLQIGLAWHISTSRDGREFVWHNGGTAGYRTFIGFEPKARTGIVVLSNAGTAAGPDDIARHLLDASSPLLAPAKIRTEITVDPQVFDRYVGRYQFAPNVELAITRDSTRFFVQLTGQPAFQIFPESEKEYFLKVVDAQLTFETDAQGQTTSVILHQNGLNQQARRLP